ncbi:MAG: hypothetical protein ACP5H9_03385 [Candidatus Woesearchaeota archaeon]
MFFQTEYYSPMDREYFSSEEKIEQPFDIPSINQNQSSQPLIRMSDIGQTVSEGPQLGTLKDQLVLAIRKGVGKVELQTTMEGAGYQPGGGGAESYGVEDRDEIRKIAEINQVELTGVHAPPQIANLSGLAENRFSDELRETQISEIKKAIDFAASVGAKAVTIHTGEFPRPIWEAEWNKEGKWKNAFMTYEEEPEKAAHYLVDSKTGNIITEVARNIVVYEPVYKRAEKDGISPSGKQIHRGDYLDINGEPTQNPEDRVPIMITDNDVGKEIEGQKINSDMVGKFLVVPRGWDYFKREAEEFNKRNPGRKITPEEMFYKTRLESEISQMKGMTLYYQAGYEEALKTRAKILDAIKFYEDLEKKIPKEDLWKIQVRKNYGDLLPADVQNPTQYLKEKLTEIDRHLKWTHEASSSYEARAKELEDAAKRIKPISEYAKEKSTYSLAELGIYAMQQSKRPDVKKDIFISAEHIFPQMGYGSHPEELIQLVKESRNKMAELLTKERIPDPSGKTDINGNPVYIKNPFYKPGLSKEEAEREAEKHIKATLDTQHIGMWYRYFVPKPGETEEQRQKRFNEWYMDMIKKMEDEKIIGNIHLVDGFGRGHTHLPAGQGLMPVKDAIEYLKSKGYKEAIVSEGYGMGADNIITEPWRLFGASIYAVSPERARSWTDVHQSYFNKMQSPYFIFGAYAPSNEWVLWSEVPFE